MEGEFQLFAEQPSIMHVYRKPSVEYIIALAKNFGVRGIVKSTFSPIPGYDIHLDCNEDTYRQIQSMFNTRPYVRAN